MGFQEVTGLHIDGGGLPWKNVAFTMLLAKYAFEMLLDYRQYRIASRKLVPIALKGTLDQETCNKAFEYSGAGVRFRMVEKTFSLAQWLALLSYDILPWVWNITIYYSELLPSSIRPRSVITQSIVFYILFSDAVSLFGLPLTLYNTFVLEERFGFNKTTLKTFIIDYIKWTILAHTIVPPIIYFLLKIVDRFSSGFVSYICAFSIVLIAFQILLMPIIIKWFYTLKPIEEGPLKLSVEALAKRVQFPLGKIFIMDSSTRSSHSNAFFTGLPFLQKTVVLFDTLVESSSVEEITAVLAHEFGHWKLHHMPQLVIVSRLQLLFTVWLFQSTYQNVALYEAFGFHLGTGKSTDPHQAVVSALPVLVGYFIFDLVSNPLQSLSTFLFSWFSRKKEYEADAYSKELGYTESLSKALIILSKQNLTSPAVDSWYSAYHYGHPSLPERLHALGYKGQSESKKE